MKSLIFLMVFVLLPMGALAQPFTDSKLPIVLITTDSYLKTGQPLVIPDDIKALANMKIIYRPDGTRNYMTDQNNTLYLNYNGRMGIEVRGSSSQALPKKPYGFTTFTADNVTNNNVSLLGMPKENDWVLNSLAFDPSFIRDPLSYELARDMGQYGARGMFCEVVIDGDYKGLYVLMEKLKIDTNRINILKLTTSDITSPALTGGYVTKADKTTGGDPVAWTMGYTDFIHESPKPEVITTQQHNYIYNQFSTLQAMATARNYSIYNGFPTIIDVPSFLDFMLINELASNADAYQFSTYFHKDRSGKLRAGPVWDFNLTYGNDLFLWGLDRSHTDVWQFDNGDNTGPAFWRDLYNNSKFKCYLSKRWTEVTDADQPLNALVVNEKIDSMVTLITEAAIRDEARWNNGAGPLADHISAMKSWLAARFVWMDARLSSFSTCANPAIPALVISKIHYNPLMADPTTSNEYEFIEITNNSSVSVNLTGVYFREPGLNYQFPNNSTLPAHERIYLASNAAAFQEFYGKPAFGQFTRNLSNKSHNLVLVDAFGNVIDAVRYADAQPWPEEADGNGSFLQLVDLALDNSLASSWMASDQALSLNKLSLEGSVQVYPNPARTTISIQTMDRPVVAYVIHDLTGRIVQLGQGGAITTIRVEALMRGTYFIRLSFEDGRSVIKKVVKE